MTTEGYLSSKGVTVEIARDFILNNYELNLETVFSVCKEYGVNNDMIAEILESVIPGLTGTVVKNFFDTNQFDGNALGFNSEVVVDEMVTGNLDLSNLFSYGQIHLYQNVSEDFVNAMPDVLSFLGGDYAYANSDTWDSIMDLGFTDNYSVLDVGSEAAHTNDYSTTAVGYDVALAESGTYFGVSSSVGPYDMIIGL